mmetsp:Transcript_133499/g.386442  ORF Transcript_133499/g.386442 Transcript_133499/m.386442 type:complete len:270 (+) Transcript_133499:285-1094(+)
MAFLLTWSNFCNSLVMPARSFSSRPLSWSLYFAMSAGTTVRFRIFSSASCFLLANAVTFMDSSSKHALSCEMAAWSSCSLAVSRSWSFRRTSSVALAFSACAFAASSSLPTIFNSASNRSTAFLRSRSRSTWSLEASLRASASSSRKRLRKNSPRCCSLPRSSRSKLRHRSSTASASVSSSLPRLVSRSNSPRSAALRRPKASLDISACIERMASSQAASQRVVSSKRSRHRWKATSCRVRLASLSCCSSAARTNLACCSPRSSCNWRR